MSTRAPSARRVSRLRTLRAALYRALVESLETRRLLSLPPATFELDGNAVD